MKNRNAHPVPLSRPGRCKTCGGAMKWETEITAGSRVDLYKCIMCGREADQVAVERRRG